MNSDDAQDELGRLLRSLDPAHTPVDTALTAQMLAIRDRIAGPAGSSSATSRTRPKLLASTLLPLVVVLLVVMGLIVLPSPSPASAYGPRPLAVTLNGRDAQRSANEVLSMLRQQPASQDVRRQRTAWWAIEMRDGRPPAPTPAVDTNISEIDWREDGRAHLVVIAGEAMFVDGSGTTTARSDGRPVGGVISDETFDAGEYQPSLTALPRASDSLEAMLSMWGLTPHSTAGDFASVIPSALLEWNPSSTSQAVLFDALRQLEGFTVLGDTVDRLGRRGVAFEATTPEYPTRRFLVIMSAQTGRFLSIEQMTVGEDPHYVGVPDGTVVDYTAWPDEQ